MVQYRKPWDWFRSVLIAALAGTCSATAFGTAAAARPDAPAAQPGNPVIIWSLVGEQAITAACLAPGADPALHARLATITSIAVHDAINTIDPRFSGYASFGHWLSGSLPGAVAAATHAVLVPALESLRGTLPPGCSDRGIAIVEKRYAEAMAQLPDTADTIQGVAIGEGAARAILERGWRVGGGRHPGWDRWAGQPTFVLTGVDRLATAPRPSADSTAQAAAVEESRRVGGDGFVTPSERTPEQTDIALFWRQSPALSWNGIARDLATRRRLDPWQTARMLGVLNITIADAYVAAAASHPQRLSVVRRIRSAGRDADPMTLGDPSWTPLTGEGPAAGFETAAAFVAGSAAAALIEELGADRTPFSTCSRSAPIRSCGTNSAELRRFDSLSAAAAEAGRAQVLLGRQLAYEVSTDLREGAWMSDQTAGPADPLTTPALRQNCYPGGPPQPGC